MTRYVVWVAALLLPALLSTSAAAQWPGPDGSNLDTWFRYNGQTIVLFPPDDVELPTLDISSVGPGGFESFSKRWFPESVYINSFTLWSNISYWGPGLLTGEYSIRFATTATREEVPTESQLFFNRVTTDPFELFDFGCCGTPINADITFSSSTPYLYRPSQGYLRMSIGYIPSGDPHPTCTAEQLALPNPNDAPECYFWEKWADPQNIFDEDGHPVRWGATFGVTPATEVVPEPLTVLLFGTGLAGIGAARRRRRSNLS